MSKRGIQYYTTETKRKASTQGLSQNGIKTQKIKKKKNPQINNLNNRIFIGTIRNSVQGDASDTHVILEQRNLEWVFLPFQSFQIHSPVQTALPKQQALIRSQLTSLRQPVGK